MAWVEVTMTEKKWETFLAFHLFPPHLLFHIRTHWSPQSQSLASIKCSCCHQWSSSHHGNCGNPGLRSSGRPQPDASFFPGTTSPLFLSPSFLLFLTNAGETIHTSPPHVVLYTHPSHSQSFVSLTADKLACGAPSCHKCQSCGPIFLPVLDDESVHLMCWDRIIFCQGHISLFTCYITPSSDKCLPLWGFSIQKGLGQLW